MVLKGSKLFTNLNLVKAYHISLAEDSKNSDNFPVQALYILLNVAQNFQSRIDEEETFCFRLNRHCSRC